MQEAAAIPEKGCGIFCAKELEERFEVKTTITSAVRFSADKDKIIEIAYLTQTAKRIILPFAEGNARTLEELEADLKQKLNPEEINAIIKEKTIRVDCERNGEHNYNSSDAEAEAGKIIESITEKTTDLKNPESKIYMSIEGEKYILGLDITGKDLSKRQYRVFNHPHSIKGTIAFSLLIFSGYDNKKTIVDPFALSGVIPIESALYATNISTNYYDKNMAFTKLGIFKDIDCQKIMKQADAKQTSPKGGITSFDATFKNVTAQKKNAKIAGVEKHIAFTRTEGHDLDLKMPEKSVDIIATAIIEPSKHLSDNTAERIYEQFFKNIKPALKKNATIAFIARNPELAVSIAEKHGYKKTEQAEVFQGKQRMTFTKLTA